MGLRKLIWVFGPPVLMIYTFIAMTPASTWNDPDTFFHIALGRAMFQQGHVIHEAIQTFAGEHLPYVTHEVGFQLLVGGLYQLGEWRGLYLLTTVSLGLLFWGLYRLVKVARKEEGMDDIHPFLILLLPVFLLYIFHLYFKVRPQMLSAPFVVWFVVILREFKLQPSWKKAAEIGVVSLLISNVHAGVWPVIAVFFCMMIIETLWERNWTLKHLGAFLLLLLGGVANAGGWQTLIYFHTIQKTGFESWIQEWQPINFSQGYLLFAVVLVFLWSGIPAFQQKRIFPKLFCIGLFYLGIVNYKEHLYLALFLPYFLAVSIERVSWVADFKAKPWMTSRWFVVPVISFGLLLNFTMSWFHPYTQPVTSFPVKEMDYILQQNPHPKVLAPFHIGGYIIYRGGESLADGRFDPFVTSQTKGLHGWTAFERVGYAFESDQIISIIQYDHPDYLIFPLSTPNADQKKNEQKEKGWILQDIAHDKVKQSLGKPVFVGSYGEVYKINP